MKETGVFHDYAVGDETHRTVFVSASVSGTPELNHENEPYAFVAPGEFASYIQAELAAVNRRAVDAAMRRGQTLRV